METEPESDMNGAIESVIQFIEGQKWSYKIEAGKSVIHTGVTGKNGQWNCVAVVGANVEHILFLSKFPGIAPTNRRAACLELLSRINFGLTHGCFELDFDDGEIRFRTCIPVLEGQVPPKAIEYLILTNLFTVDRFFGAIMKVIFSEACPKQALRPAKAQSGTKSRFELN